jgi:hypothetical protein
MSKLIIPGTFYLKQHPDKADTAESNAVFQTSYGHNSKLSREQRLAL